MNILDLWKSVGKLSVDEFMCLFFELEPGTVKFDNGNPEEWPKGAVPIYNTLIEDIRAGKLYVFIEDSSLDPRFNEEFASQSFQSGKPWWVNGKLSKYAIKKWLAEKNIPSDFFGVAQPLKQIPAQGAAKEEKAMKSHEADSRVLTNSEDTGKFNPQILPPEFADDVYDLPQEWLTETPPEHKFCVEPLVPIGAVTLLNAHGGTGKSIFALTMGVHIALGLPIIGAKTKVGKVAYMALEDSKIVVQGRIFKIFNELLKKQQLKKQQLIDELTDKIIIIDRYGLPTYMAEKKYGNIITPPIADALSSLLKERKITCLFVDTFIRTNPLNENDNAEMGRLLVTYEGIAKDAECAVVLIHHLPKGNANRSYAARGASAITDNARSVLLMQIAPKGDAQKFADEDAKAAASEERLIEVTHTKHNYSAEHPKQYLIMTKDGILEEVASSSLPTTLPTTDTSFLHKPRYKELYDWWVKNCKPKPITKNKITDNAAKAIRPLNTAYGKQIYRNVLKWASKNGYAEKTPTPKGGKSDVDYFNLINLDG